MSDAQADNGEGTVTGSKGIDQAGNDAAVADVLHSVEKPSASRNVPRVDPVTGEVSGTGSGTGGGNAGEDYDHDHTAGSNTLR